MQKIEKKDLTKTLMPIIIGLAIVAGVTIITQNMGVGIIIGVVIFTWFDNNAKMKLLETKLDNLSKEKEILEQNAP